MLDIPKAAFSYLAFSKASQSLLTYGRTAAEAGQWAGEIAPGAPIQVLPAGPYGRTLWNRKISLASAQRALRRAHELA